MDPNTLIALAAAGGVFCLGFLLLGSGESKGDQRVKKLSGNHTGSSGILARLKTEDGGWTGGRAGLWNAEVHFK